MPSRFQKPLQESLAKLSIAVLATALPAISPKACCGQEQSAEDNPLAKLPGLKASGNVLLPNGWTINAQGKQTTLGDFPVHMLVAPQSDELAILHCGYGEHEIITIEPKALNKITRTPIPQSFYGLQFSTDGKHILASGGEDEKVYIFPYNQGFLGPPKTLTLGTKTDKFVVSGVLLSQDNQSLYACGLLGNALKRVRKPLEIPGSAPNGKNEITKADLVPTEILALPEQSYPYAMLEDVKNNKLYVSLWGRAEIAVIDLASWKIEATLKTKSHPTEMLLLEETNRLAVACSDENSVVLFDRSTGELQEVLATALYPAAKNGSTPSAIALSPDQRVLVAVNSCNNNIALFDLSEPKKSRSLGFIPVGWYPTNVKFSKDGQQIFVTNGKGMSSKDNRYGPNPTKSAPKNLTEYIGGLFQGSLSAIPTPRPEELASMTRLAFQSAPLQADSKVDNAGRSTDNPIPAKVGDPSPIKHCFYIIKENRTYDQLFGDVAKGNGDASLCIFGEQVTPNHHALVNQFVLLDNFYVDGEVSADGHEWTMAAYANDFVEKTWPLTYGKSRGKLTYPAEGATKIGQPSSGYLWGKCAEAGKSYFSFGEFIANGSKPGEPSRAKIPVLEGHFDPNYRSYDLDYSDLDRAESFIKRLKQFEAEDNLPSFITMHLPNDHTAGTRVGKLTPTAMVAQNDAALGKVVEAITKSKFWPQCAIFVIQDDVQNGSDHVDAHRSVALAISPYIRRGSVDSTMYSTSSMLRTMELIIGVEPMTQFDAAARPMYNAFHATVDSTPYEALAPRVDITATNQALAWGADISEQMDFSIPDAADDLILNDIVWRSVRGANSPMPPPIRAAFVFAKADEDEDEDEDGEEDDSSGRQ
ncbi:MAG: bifunctional YncE family protein/alkaline phosphatase family protein [Pirellula sp.]